MKSSTATDFFNRIDPYQTFGPIIEGAHSSMIGGVQPCGKKRGKFDGRQAEIAWKIRRSSLSREGEGICSEDASRYGGNPARACDLKPIGLNSGAPMPQTRLGASFMCRDFGG